MPTPPQPSYPSSHPLSTLLATLPTPLIQGGAAWSYQLHPAPYSLPATSTLLHALNSGIRAFDTSPYYDPSELILGAALASPEIASIHPRSNYLLFTKVGRVNATTFDYSPQAVRESVERSLARFGTEYLDVVFCHDVEFVEESEVLDALAVLWDFVAQGKIRYVGISGYPLEVLVRLAERARERFGKPLDVVQSWAQLTVQNTRLVTQGLEGFRGAGVGCVCSSSPLAIGLLRDEGVPEGKLGDFHPAPREMRERVARAARLVKERGGSLADLASRYAIWEAGRHGVFMIGGAGTDEQVDGFVGAWKTVHDGGWGDEDQELIELVRKELGEWVDYCFT
ncbi:Aldo/keto reductase family-domain-containing protein [Dendryphion nanum]|uniref:Aldo/keto reductase family-domain-containing protein n=1 Tax=Dendryphion nanum TaxID=256645 RepID=A0A9P9E0Q4_9PLEO|nr:Aldo/keto reductase family-domain-containing protein [Dendryphion nanum]